MQVRALAHQGNIRAVYIVECARLGQLTLHGCEMGSPKHGDSLATIKA